MTTVAFKNRKDVFNSKLELDLTRKLVKYNVWSTALCGDENWVNRKIDHQYMGNFEEGWTRLIGMNKEVLHELKKERNIEHAVKRKEG